MDGISIELIDANKLADAGTNIRVLITSRAGILDIEHNIEADAVYEIRSNDNDVRLYLEKSLRGQERLSRWMMDDPDLEASITEAILPQLSGMFLLARLYVDLLAEERTKRGVHRSLKKLPKGVDNTYAEAWNRICNQKAQQADIGRKVLLWVIYASRPLRWQELQYGLAIEEGDTQVESDGLLEIDDLTSFCAGLVVIDTQRDQVSLVHPTTNEYFEERKHLLFPAGDDTIAAACITHLLMDTFKTEGVCSEPDSFDRRWRQNPFLGYAAVCWGSHVRKAATNTGSDLSLRLLRDESARSAAVQVLTLNALGVSSVYYLSEWPPLIDADVRMTLGPKITRSRFRNSRKYIGALHLAAYFGLVSVVEGLLDSQSAVNEPDEMGATALHWAILGNQNVMLNLLLERGANVRACASKLVLRRWASDRRGTFSLPLHIASALGNTTAIETLLEHQAEINRVSLGTTALDAAIKMDQLAAARTLRAHGAGVNIGATPIDEAIRGGLDTVKLLIDGGLSSNLLHEALYRAASLRELSSMALILDAGANPDGSDTSSLEHPYDDSDASSTDEKLPCKDEDKRSKNTNGGEETVSEDGIKASESMNLYETYRSGSLAEVPLIESLAEWPVQRSEATRCCILLINAGADVNRIGRRQYIYRDDWQLSNPWGDIILPRGRKTTPLHTAAYFGELDAARELVQAGANINLSLGEQYTPLTSALHREGYIHHSDNPLTASSSLRARAMLQLLVDLGADPGLCTAHDRARIEKLLSLSPDDCEYLRALQSVVAVEYLETPSKRSFRDRIHALREILHKGANPELCCQKEQKIIEDFLSLSEEEVDEFDNARQRKLAERDLWVVGIW